MIGVIFKGVGSVIVMAKTDEVPILDSESAFLGRTNMRGLPFGRDF